MAQYLPLPDGSSVTIREGESPQDAWSRAQRMYPEAFKAKEPEAKPEGGFVAASKAGLASLKGDIAALAGRSGLMDEAAAEKYIKEQEEYKKKTFKPTEEGWTEAPVTKVKELLGGSLPYMAAPLAAGVVAPAGLPALGAGLAASGTQFAGSFLSRQMDEGKKLGETNLGYAVAAAVPAAALDMLSLKMLPGVRGIFAAAGKEVPERALLEATKQSTAQIAKDYALATGKAMGTEGLTEAGQQVLERLQAGLNIADEKARDEYFDSFVGGAVLGGVLAPAGRYVERRGEAAKQRAPKEEEFQKLRAEEEQRLESERQRKTTPEYAQEVVQQYDVLAKQKQDLIAQIKKIEKGSPTADADRAFNRDINSQIKTLSKELEPLADDYYKSKGMLTQMAEQERVAKLSPQEYAFGIAPETDEQKAQAAAQGPELYEQQIATPAKPKAELTPREQAAQYANQRISLANDQLNTAASFNPKFKAEATKDYVEYLMQDPELAQQLVETRTPLMGLPKGLSNAEVLDALKLQVKPLIEAKKKAELETFQKEMDVRKQALGTTKTTEQEDQSVSALRDWMDESRDKFQPSSDSDFNYLNGMFESAFKGRPQPIAVNENLKPLREAPTVRKTVEQLLDTAEQANKEHWMFRRQGNRAAAIEAAQRRNKATDQLNAMSAQKPAGVDTKGLKRGPAEEDTRASYARELIAARRGQQEAMAKLEDATSGIRSEQTLGRDVTAANTEEGLAKRAAAAQAQFIKNALQEAAIHRRAAGKPALTTDEALIAASKLHDTFNNWIARAKEKGAAPEYEDVIIEPAQMRADKIVRPAVTERRLVSGGVRKLSEAEVKHFKAIADSVRNKLSEEAPTKVQRVETGPLKRQFAAEEAKKTAEAKGETATTLGGELRRRKEYTTNLIDRALARKDVPENIRNGLERAKGMIEDGVADTRLLDAAENQAERVLRGQDLGQVTRMGREQVDAGRQVVRNVPGKEGSTEIGRRGQKFVTTGTQEKAAQEKAAFPKGAPVAVEGNEALRELEEAMALNKRVAQEQAGQKSLFPEAEEDLGYIRATPANFAKSPRMKPVWAAIDRAKELFKKTEPVRLAKEATRKNRMRLLEQLTERMDSIRKDTQFFWKDTSRWSDAEMAKVFAGMPEAGTTQEEKNTLYKYAKGQSLTPQERVQAEVLLKTFRERELPKYQTRIKEAMDLLAQGRRLQDADNQLLSFMQDTNASIKATAKALSDRMAGMRATVEYLKDVMRGSAIITPAQKALLDSEQAVEKQRGEYQLAVERAITKANKEMEAARATLLDPQIGTVSKDLETAKKTLDKEQAELDKIKKRFDSVLAQKEGANRTELATYELFRYEEKKDIVKDLKERVTAQEDALEKLVTERHEEFDGASVVIQAMLDSKVKMERQYLEMQEATLASMRGETVLDNPNAYPFAYRQAKKNLDAQKPIVQAAERRATEFKEIAKSGQQQMEEFWKDKLGGEGITSKRRRFLPEERKDYEALDKKVESLQEKYDAAKDKLLETTGKNRTKLQETADELKTELAEVVEERSALLRRTMQVSKLDTTEEKEVIRLRQQEQDKADRAYEAEQATLIKSAQAESIDKEVSDLITELGAYEEFPNELSALKKLAQDETLPQAERDAALAKAGVIQNIESLEAQREVLLEGKPRKKQRASTVASTVALSAQKPLRTGYRKALEAASEGMRAEREFGVFGESEEAPDLRGLFRTTGKGEGMTVDEVQKVADEVRKDWEVVPPVVVIQSETGLPIRIYKQLIAENMEGKAPGLYDPKTKKVYLIADNLHGTTDVALTVAHEIAGHFGLREMLGDTYADTMQSIYDGNEDVRVAAEGKMDANKALSREVAVEEVLADMAETGPYANSPAANALRRIYSAIKQWFLNKLNIANISDSEVKQLVADARRFVKTGKGARGGAVDTSGMLYRAKAVYNDDFANISATMSKVVAQDKSWWDTIKANTTGLAFETQLVDRFAGFERLAKYMEPLKGTQMLYYLRSYDQRMNIVSKAVSDGAPAIKEVTRDDGRVERLVETTGGASIAGVVNKLKDAKQYIGNGEAVNQVFTTYMAAIRAKNKGIETLNFGTDKDGKPVLTQAMLDEVTALVNKNKELKDIFEEARTEYNKYNRDLLDFVASTGALSKALVKKLVAEDDYIPFYRERKGVVELVIGNESPIRIGSIAEQPYLDKLVGGDTAIIDFMTSSVQNTNMLVDMGMRNLATKNAVMELVDLKAATLVKKADGTDVVKFKVDGDDRYAIVATEKVMIGNKEFETGIPADILVKGMEGIPTQMPFLFRVMAMPAQVLRKAVTLSPLYMAKQLFRDSLAAPILSGADFVPVLGALKEINGAAKETLEKRGITGGQYFRGTSEDLSMILREITDGKPGWMQALGKFEAMGMEADAITRRAQYNSYIEQGLSEMEATLMALESMNFNKRGASPSIHVANALIPFFNAQIQGLNVMYKAMSGKMPFNDQLRIREKMLTRGGMMAAATFAYALMMEDDEAYKNATPDQKYGNWFVRLPGVDEPVKIPVPFEIGYIFKAIPEALYNSMTTEHGGEEAVKAFKQILLQTVPGGSSYGIPQAAKPLIEVGLGKSFYTGRDILSAREKQFLPEEQYRVNTSEAAKLVGSTLGISPIKIEALVNGYTGTMGLAFLQAISLGVPSKETPEQAVKRLSEYPIVGGVFQPNDAGGIINSVYERMNEVSQVKSTVDKLLQEGKVQEAEALITKRGTDYMQSELANTFKTNMNMLTQAERAVAASKMSPEEKRKQLDEIRKMKIGLANATREISDKTIRLVGSS